jgi:hypothetical protein
MDMSEDLEQLSQQLAHAMRMDSDMGEDNVGVDASNGAGEQAMAASASGR